MDSIRTIPFDSYSTLVDVEAVEAALADRVDDPKPVSRHWRSRSLLYTVVTNEIDQYDSFYALNRAALEHALASHGIELPTAEREEILAAYHELAVFDDVRTPGSVSGPLSEQSLCRILCETEGHTIITLGGSFWPVSCPDFPALLMIGTPHAAYR